MGKLLKKKVDSETEKKKKHILTRNKLLNVFISR